MDIGHEYIDMEMDMNSKQRRKIIRDLKLNYPYTVGIEAPLNMGAADWEDQIEVMTNWCKKYYRNGWKYDWSWGDAEFYFSDSKIATHFTLRWS